MARIIAAIIASLITIVIILAVSILSGLLFWVLWNYVAALYWAGAPQVSILQAMASMALLSLLGTKVRA